MKTIKLFITAMVAVVVGVTSTAQAQNNMNLKMVSTKTETFKVWGNCDMCKTRIEKAVKEDGATSATWDQKTKMLIVTFDPSKTSVDAFGKKLSEVGHDNEKYIADDKVYNSLPDCCKYERAGVILTVDYTCPMHPDVHSNKPGKCPKCGMALRKKEITKPDASRTQQSIEGMKHN